MRAERRQGRFSLSLVVGLLAVAIVAAGIGTAALAGGRKKVGVLGVGDALFWDGDSVSGTEAESSPLPLPIPNPLEGEQTEADDCSDSRCFDYRLEVTQKGAVLRAAIDTLDCRDSFSLALISPNGSVVDEDTSCYSAEVYADDPPKGVWTARVTPSGSHDAPFRMRAKLEGPSRTPERRRRLLPNLRVEPPHEFTFDGGGGVTGAASSCQEDEIVEDGAQRCLRFSVGPQNAGVGPLELKFARSEVGTEASMQQRVYYSDGSSEMRAAGNSEFHKTHQHFHLKGFAKFELLRVTDATRGTMVKAGTGNKSGFCLVDLRIARWRRFSQQRAYSARSNCMPVGGKAELGLSAGWTDVYGYDLPGNYVEFADSRDGRYVVRVVVDSLGHILESNERDNIGYAYVSVKGQKVTILERGQGRSPWDPDKVAFDRWSR